MARSRKIPARKHHGVRDPLKQLEEKEKKLKGSVNNPPEKGNDQKVSYKFAQFKKLVDDTKTGKKMKKLTKGTEDKPKTKTSDPKNKPTEKKFKDIKRFEDETDKDYLRRVNRITTESLNEAQYEAKYGVNVIRDAKTGMITVKKRPKNEIDELLKQKQKQKRSSRKGRGKAKQVAIANPIDPKVAKELIKRAIKEDNEEQKQERAEQVEYKQDVVKFGEVVHAPPNLSTLPRKAQKSETVPRPGQKNNLLLKTMLNKTTTVATNTKQAQDSKKSKKASDGSISKAQLRGRRKNLPAATRTMLDTEQSKLIELYRNLKKSKEKSMVAN